MFFFFGMSKSTHTEERLDLSNDNIEKITNDKIKELTKKACSSFSSV